MESSLHVSNNEVLCSVCKRSGGDVSVIDCGCTMHVCCIPLEIVLDKEAKSCCPACNAGINSGLWLVPLSFRDINRAIELKTEDVIAKSNVKTEQKGIKRGNQSDFELKNEVCYSLLSHGRKNRAEVSVEDQRTGRWTDQETAFVDLLIWAFDQGILPIPNGTKLNQFLSEMLVCKLSRLTKKMKNAKLSANVFSRKPITEAQKATYAEMSKLQSEFLSSTGSESSELELRFNLMRQWRVQFSNLCLQVGYPLQKLEFMSSLDDLARRAKIAEGAIRKRRRLNLGASLGLQSSDTSSEQYIPNCRSNPFLSELDEHGENPRFKPNYSRSASMPDISHAIQQGNGMLNNQIPSNSSSFNGFVHATHNSASLNRDTLSPINIPDHLSAHSGSLFYQREAAERSRSLSEDFDNDIMTLMQPDPIKAEEISLSTTSHASREKITSVIETEEPPPEEDQPRTFMDVIAMYMETHNLPFHHADAWVPSHVQTSDKGDQEVKLLHAGYTSRRDISDEAFSKLNDFGEYSKAFSFDISGGLPGRVYASGEDIWEFIGDSPQTMFARFSGAKSHGLKSAVGFPLSTNGVGRMVIVLYSFGTVEKDSAMVSKFAEELTKYAPEPKWKLVIEVGKDAPIRNSGMYDCRSGVTSGRVRKRVDNTSSHRQSHHRDRFGSAHSSPSLSPRPNPEFSRLLSEMDMDSSTSSSIQQMASSGSQSGQFSPTSMRQLRSDPTEQSIIQLLGDQIPPSYSDYTSASYSSAGIDNFIPYCKSIRLLLLRPPESRSKGESQMVETLKSSYKAFTGDNKRSGTDLAMLLVRDWICLSTTVTSINSSEQSTAQSSNAGSSTQPVLQGMKRPSPLSRPPPPTPLLPPGSRLSRPPAPNQPAYPRRVSTPGSLHPLNSAQQHVRHFSVGEFPQNAPNVSNHNRRQSTGGIQPLSTVPPFWNPSKNSGI